MLIVNEISDMVKFGGGVANGIGLHMVKLGGGFVWGRGVIGC